MAWHEWIRTVEIEPALDAAEAPSLEGAVEALLRTGCRIFHVHAHDVLDVAPIGSLAALARRYDGILDVHVRGSDALSSVGELAAAGAHSITFDAHAVADPAATIEELRSHGVQVGIAVADDVAVESAAETAAGADLILCECEDDSVVERVQRLASLLAQGVEVQVEGDVTHDTVRALFDAGARLLVVDTPIFEREDLPRAYRRLVQALA